MIRDYAQIAIENLKQRSLRSWLTTLGVIISVAAIVILILVSNGLKLAITEQFNKLGSQRVFVMAGDGGQPGVRSGLSTRDVESLERMGAFKYVLDILVEPSVEVTSGRKTYYGMVFGFPPKYIAQNFADYDLTFEQGRAFHDGESDAVILGSLVAHEHFDKDLSLHNQLLINKKTFTVVGILNPVGNDQDDSQIYIPLPTARELFNKSDGVSFIDLTVKNGIDISAVAERIERQLKRDRGDDNFHVMTPAQILRFLNTILGIVQGILVSIAGISLLVGAIGIMNMMFTSVLERTKEIGVMKSVGARNRDILLLFVFEAGLLGFFGGIMGSLLGSLVSLGIGFLAAQAGFSLLAISFEPLVVLSGILFATAVGMISGLMPAYRAAYLHPVDALRWNS